MKVVELETDKLIPYEWNNKIHDVTQVDRIANSIKEFGFKNPILVDKNNIIIAWHWRLEAAKKLWLEKVPVIIADDLTEEQIKKYRILDNKLNESEWDLANLKLELDSLGNLDIWDLKLSTTDLFPEMDTPEFDENEFNWPDMSDKIWWEYSILLKFTTPEEQQVMYDTLQEMWGFRDIKIL